MDAKDNEDVGKFDGSNPTDYKRWKRRATIMLMSLPTTIPKEKYAVRLLKLITGEAEGLCEDMNLEDLLVEGGETAVFKILDAKYLPMEKDLMQASLKTYFYELTIKQGEDYKQFLVRYETAVRKLQQSKIELPSEVKGWMLMRKMRLDDAASTMLLTATQGSIELPRVIKGD
jgi:hypothetical protein